METPRNARPLYPENHAFVVQFQCGSEGATARAGRVEHVATGRASRFEDGAELLAFVTAVLGGLAEQRQDERQR